MADFTDLVLYLSTKQAIAWVGAGPSVEMGLPTWRGLANTVLETCRRQQKYNFTQIERLYRAGAYPDQFDEVELTYGKEFLYSICDAQFKDPGHIGTVYSELSKLHFKSYFTTNYDNILLRHLENSRKAVTTYTNSQDDLSDIDLDMIPSIVKLHGQFSDPQSVVLTRSDYQNLYLSGPGEAFRTFLKAVLGRDRILFLGYSLNDPEILYIQEQLAVNLRRKVAQIAILPNASGDDVRYWKQRFNIDVVPYAAKDGDHSSLASMLKSVADVIAVGHFAPHRTPSDDLRKSQALYMWYRFKPSEAGQAPVDALQSIILSALTNSGGVSSHLALANTIADEIGADIEPTSPELISAIKRLEDTGWLTQCGSMLSILPEGEQLTKSYQRRFDRLIEVFTRQLSLDLKNEFQSDDSDINAFTHVILNALIDLFELRGRNIMELVFDDTPIDQQSITDILQILWRRANTLADPNTRSALIGFILNMLMDPTGIYEAVLSYFARSFFCIQAMKVDPEVPKLLAQAISDRTLLIDENILIPLTALYEDRHEFLIQIVQKARESNLSLCTTQRFVDTVRRHADWAYDLVNQHGTQSEQVLSAARGDSGYAPNAFLQGYINQDPDNPDRDFIQYLRDCFGGTYLRKSFDSYFENELGIRVLDIHDMGEFTQSKSNEYTEASALLNQWNETRPNDSRKSLRRIESEVEALLLVSNWSDAIKTVSGITTSRVSFITAGSSVPRLIRQMNSDVAPMTVASADTIWELLSRPEVFDGGNPSFRSIMLATHFRLAGHFVHTENYRHFFRPLIANAKQELEEYRDLFENVLGEDDGGDIESVVDQEDLPRLLSSLQIEASDKAGDWNRERQEFIEEIERLRKKVYDSEERERKRREYVARQRREQRERRSRR